MTFFSCHLCSLPALKTADYQVDLTDEELSFIMLTVSLSNTENFRKIQSELTGEKQKDPGRTYNFTNESRDDQSCSAILE